MKTNKWLWPVGIFILFAVILVLPHWHRLLALGTKYTTLVIGSQEVDPTSLEETYAYATLANRTRFNQPINDPYVLEYRNFFSPFLSELFPAVFVGGLAKVFGLPLVFILLKIISPILLVLLFTKISRNIGYSFWISFSAGLAAVFLPRLFALIPYIDIFSYVSNSSELEFQRLFHPALSWLIVLGSVLGAQIILSEKFSTVKTLVSGILLGLLFYTYFFAWTLVWFGLGILVVILFWQKKFNELKRLIMVVTVGFIVGLPYFMNGWRFSRTEMGKDFLGKTLLAAKEVHVVTMLRYAVLAVGLIVIDRDWWKRPAKLLLWSIMAAAILLPDMSQLILGVNIESDHWIVRFLYPLSTFLSTLFIGRLLSDRKIVIEKIFVGILLVMAILRVGMVSVNQWKLPIEGFQVGVKREELYRFLSQSVAKDSVIGSLSFTEQIYLAAYTPFYPFVPRWERTVAPKDEPMQRLLFLAQQLKVTDRYFDDVMPVPLIPVSYPDLPVFDQKALAVVFGTYYLFDKPPYQRHQQLLIDVKKRYGQSISQPGKLDYLLVSPTDREFSTNNFLLECEPLFNNSIYQLYFLDVCDLSG